jgi:Domain of unknown function (DUF4440)
MQNSRIAAVVCGAIFLWAGDLGASSQGAPQPPTPESAQTVWNLEHAYWRYVESNDLPAYRALWHKDFLGWPSVNAAPVHKDHITDWITSQTAKGLAFKLVEFKPAALQVTGNLVVTCYWVTFQWLDQDGKGATATIRITHTWLKDGKDRRIIAGMSMPEHVAAPK